jgi:hypothetical protein
MKKFNIKNYTNSKIKGFNINRLIALLISSIIILCIKYYFNYFGYVTDLSLIFILFCALLKSITLVTVESIRDSDLNKDDILNSKIHKNVFSKKIKYIDIYTNLSYNYYYNKSNSFYENKYIYYNVTCLHY